MSLNKVNINSLFIIISFSFIVSSKSFAQSKLNFGLTRQQPSATLPVGLSKYDIPQKKSKTVILTKLKKNSQGDYLLDSGWELAENNIVTSNTQSIFSQVYNSTNWYNAVVPGTVLTSLVKEGIYPDPYIGLNNRAIPDDLCRKDWWYRISFSAPEEDNNKLVWLKLNGINYKADIWINGKL